MAESEVSLVSIPAKPPANEEARVAFVEIKPALMAIPVAELVRINVDIPRTVSRVLGVVPNIDIYLDRMATLAEFDAAPLIKLRTYALATLYAHITTVDQSLSIDELVTKATSKKQRMLVWADALVASDLMDGDRVAEIRLGSGHVDLATDLIALAALYEEGWNRIGSKIAITHDEIAEASELGTALLSALGMRDAMLPGPDAHDMRQRAFTLLVRTYDQGRRGLSFLRWDEDDVDLIAPSLFAQRKRKATTPSNDAANPPEGSGAATSPVVAPPATPPGATTPVSPPAAHG